MVPVLISVYDRRLHLERCIDSLRKNDESKKTTVYICSDYPLNPFDQEKVEQVRSYIDGISGFKNVVPIFRDVNLGAGNNINEACRQVFQTYDEIIIMEDDVVVGKYFLKFMNDGLRKYKRDKNVLSICGYLPPDIINKNDQAFFLSRCMPYGIGFWKDKWMELDACVSNASEAMRVFKSFRLFRWYERFSPHVVNLLYRILHENFLPADVLMEMHMQRTSMLSLYPPESLTASWGYDGSGVNCDYDERLQSQVPSDSSYTISDQISLRSDVEMNEHVMLYFRGLRGNKLKNYIAYFVNRLPFGYFLYGVLLKFNRLLKRFIRK